MVPEPFLLKVNRVIFLSRPLSITVSFPVFFFLSFSEKNKLAKDPFEVSLEDA